MKLLICSATRKELQPLVNYLQENGFRQTQGGFYQRSLLQVYTLVTGIGGVSMATSLTPLLFAVEPDMAICTGIAGAFPGSFEIGDVVNVESEQFGDLGVEEADGSFHDVFEIQLIDPNEFPFRNGVLVNPYIDDAAFLPLARGLTVNRVHGSKTSIEYTMEYYDVDIESMEGAAFFYTCLIAEIPFLEIRAISNYVEPRNRENWQIDEAILHLNDAIIEMVEVFSMGDKKSSR